MRPLSSRWISTKLTSTYAFYSTPPPLQSYFSLLWGHLRPPTFFFLSLLKAKCFSHLKALCYVSDWSMGTPLGSPCLLHKAFLRPLLTYASPIRFPFLSVTDFERLHRADSHTITGCLLSSSIPLLLSEISLPPLRVTLTRFALCYERALQPPLLF